MSQCRALGKPQLIGEVGIYRHAQPVGSCSGSNPRRKACHRV